MTKGPWFLVETCPTDDPVIEDINGEEVLGVSEWIRAEEDDLRLMAAAPELLKALKEIVFLSDRKHDVWDKAKAIITKIETGYPPVGEKK